MIEKTKYLFLSILFVLLGGITIFAQGSFVREVGVDFTSTSQYLSQLEEGAGDHLSFLYSDPGFGDLQFTELDLLGEPVFSRSVGIDQSAWTGYRYRKRGNFQLGVCTGFPDLTNPRNALVVLNFEQGNYWAKQLSIQAARRDMGGFTNSGKVYSSFYMEDNMIFESKLGIALFNQENGNQQWGFHYERSDTPIPNEEQSYTVFNMESFADNSLIAQVRLAHRDAGSSAAGNIVFGHCLLHVDDAGSIIKSIGIDNDVLFYDIDVTDSNNLYLAMRVANEEDTMNERNSKGVLVKFDKDFNIVWAKKLVAENFNSLSMRIKTKPNGNVIFSYVTYGDLPVITGEITSGGDLLWYRGYSFFSPLISIGSDNAIYFTSKKKYFENGTFDYRFIIAKTLPTGEIEGCPQFDACLSLEDIDINFDTWEWTREVASPLPDLEVSLDTAYFSSTPYCGTPLPPRADFILPDTICQYECITPDSTYNRLAHQIEWRITGAEIDTIIVDTIFNWCFETPGHYEISQEVWLLGCSDYYQRSLVVLSDDLEVSLGADRTICTPKPYDLKVSGTRPLMSYLWNDGSEHATLEVDTLGEYSVTATDGYCIGSNQVVLTFLEDLIQDDPLILPSDTVICNDFLPFVLRPKSLYTSEFYLEDGVVASDEFALSQTGNYQVWFSLEGCLIQDEFVFETQPCEVPVFIPNVFSPNEDGINDFITPLGVDFEGVSIEIFDRWGGRLFYERQPPFRWDGQVGGRDVPAGVYVLVFHYLNKRNGLKEVVSKDVLLMR